MLGKAAKPSPNNFGGNRAHFGPKNRGESGAGEIVCGCSNVCICWCFCRD